MEENGECRMENGKWRMDAFCGGGSVTDIIIISRNFNLHHSIIEKGKKCYGHFNSKHQIDLILSFFMGCLILISRN